MKYKLICATLLLIIFESSAYGCRGPMPPKFWLKASAREVEKAGCVRDHARLALMYQNNDPNGVINIAKKLDTKGLLDGPSLRIEAEMLYKVKKYREALNIHLRSLTEPQRCNMFMDCHFEDSNAILHYKSAKYYKAAGYLYKAEDELREGDLEFDEICPRTGTKKHVEECINLHEEMLKSYFQDN